MTSIITYKKFTVIFKFALTSIEILLLNSKINIPILIHSPEDTGRYYVGKNHVSYVIVNKIDTKYHGILNLPFKDIISKKDIKKSMLDLIKQLLEPSEIVLFKTGKKRYQINMEKPFLTEKQMIDFSQLIHIQSQQVTGDIENLEMLIPMIPIPINKLIPINYFGNCSGNIHLDLMMIRYLIFNGYKINNILFNDMFYNSPSSLFHIPRDTMKHYKTGEELKVKFANISPLYLENKLRNELKINGKIFFSYCIENALKISQKNELQFNFCITFQGQSSSKYFKTFYTHHCSTASKYINVWYDCTPKKILLIENSDITNNLSYRKASSENTISLDGF